MDARTRRLEEASRGMTGPIAGRELGTVARTGGGTRELGNRCQTRVPESNPGDEAAVFGVNQYHSVVAPGATLTPGWTVLGADLK
jgi:hypothetical protein